MNKEFEKQISIGLKDGFKNISIKVGNDICAYGKCTIIEVSAKTLKGVNCGATYILYDEKVRDIPVEKRIDFVVDNIKYKINKAEKAYYENKEQG